MQRKAFGLAVLLIPAEAQPVEAFEDRLQRRLGIALEIRVVDAQNHGAADCAAHTAS
jgi:hypothetical protein